MDERMQRVQLAVSGAILRQLVLLNSVVAITHGTAVPEELCESLLDATRGANELAELVRDALTDGEPEWARGPDDDE